MAVTHFLGRSLRAAMATAALIPALAFAQPHIIKLDAKINNQDNPRQLYLRAGTYQVQPIGHVPDNKKSAWSVWNNTNCTHAKGCQRTVPTKFTGLHNNYYVVSDQLDNIKVMNKAIPQVKETPRDRLNSYFLVNEQSRAFEVAQPRVYANEASALTGAQTATFTMKEGGRIFFALLDNGKIKDNRGGMNLRITPVNTPKQ